MHDFAFEITSLCVLGRFAHVQACGISTLRDGMSRDATLGWKTAKGLGERRLHVGGPATDSFQALFLLFILM